MNALEQEYRDNVKRADRRENVRIVALIVAGLGTASGVAALTGHAGLILPGLFVAVWTIVDGYFRYAPRIVPEPADDAPADVERGYREAALPARQEPPKKVTSVTQNAIGFVLFLAALSVLTLNWDHVSTRFVGNMLTLIGMLLVIGGQRVHAAWKRWHDAKLMIEWERRLEEKG